MSLANENGNMVMPVGPMYSNGNGFGSGWGGDGFFWLLIIFVIAAMGGNGFGFGGWGGNGAVNTVNNDLQRGFDQQAVMGGIGGINQQLYTTQMAMQTGFCDNRLAVANLGAQIAAEACADRAAVANALQDITAQNNANTQRILDKMCQQEIDALKTQNANLQTQINLANMAASQAAQTGQILADNANQTANLLQRLNPTPIPAYAVQNPNCCTNSCNRFVG